MKCSSCDGNYIKKHKPLVITDKFIGPYKTKTVEYFECNKCGDILLTPASSQQMDKDRESALEYKLKSKPLKDFISATETAVILGISRQALHKHRRIRRGFIYQTKFCGKTVYLKDSVCQFKKTGDGRFPLWKKENDIKYLSTQITTILPDNIDFITDKYMDKIYTS